MNMARPVLRYHGGKFGIRGRTAALEVTDEGRIIARLRERKEFRRKIKKCTQ